MALQTAVLQPGVVLGTATAPIYTVPGGKSAWVKRALFVNTSAAAVTITVTLTRAGGSALTIISNQSLGPNVAYVSPELSSLALAAGDIVSASAGTAAVVNAVMSGLTA